MQNTRQITQRIKTAGNISKITKAMEMVSASKMRRAQNQALATRSYSQALQKSLAMLSQASDKLLHPFLEEKQHGSELAILISTDKGLCGSLNPTLFKAAFSWAKEHSNAQFIIIGRKAVLFSKIFGFDVEAQFIDLPEKVSVGDILPISSLVSHGFLEGKYKKVHVIYMDFVSTLVQKVTINQILPIKKIEEPAEEIIRKISNTQYIFEPSTQEILNQILPYYLENSIFQSFLEARASEHSARMVSMKNASENAHELMGELRLEFNKTRQASVTSELLDITTARLAQSN